MSKLIPHSSDLDSGDLNAYHYRQNSELQYSIAQDPLQAHAFIGNESILDIGCGDGKITAELARKVPHGSVIGVDKSPSMIHLARESFPKDQYPNLSFEVQDATQLNISLQFDLITSFSCLHWIKDQRAALQHLHYLLKPSGKAILLTFPKCPTFWGPIEAIADSDKWQTFFKDDPRPYQFFNEQQYRELLPKVGLKILTLETTSHMAKFVGKKGFEDYVRGWLPFLIALPKHLHDEFLDEIGTKSLEFVPISDDGCVYHPYEKIFCLVHSLT